MTESFCLNPSSVQSPPNKMVDRETEIMPPYVSGNKSLKMTWIP